MGASIPFTTPLAATGKETGFRVLIADRNPRVRGLLARELSRDGLSASGAKNGDEVLRAVESGATDLLVLAEDLPDMGGLDVLRRVRRVTGLLPVVVIAYSAEAIPPYLEEKFVSYVRKGENLEALARAVTMMLKRRCAVETVSGDRAAEGSAPWVQAGASALSNLSGHSGGPGGQADL